MWQAWRNEDNAVRKSIFSIYILLIVMTSKFYYSIGGDTLSRGKSISGSETIVSQDGTFELGFFKKGGSRAYLGIWYKAFAKETIVWVANRETPLLNISISSNPTLEVSEDGNLVLFHESETIWSTNLTSALPNSVEGVLLDCGNLVLRDNKVNSTIFWQSFDHPTDTWLPGSKLGYNDPTGRPLRLISWKNSEDPSPGMFSVAVDYDTRDNYFLEWNTSVRYWSSGTWNGKVFSFAPEMSYTLNFNLISKENETYFTYSLYNDAVLSRLVINASGNLEQFTSLRNNLTSVTWGSTFAQPRKQSHVYALCGAFSIFSESHSNKCTCLQGFTPYFEDSTKLNDWSSGCVRKISLQCENSTSVKGKRDGFAKVPSVKVPSNAMVYPARNAKECESACLENCSCTAYAYHEQNCSVWDGVLWNVQQLDDDTNKEDLYLKLAGSELPDVSGKKNIWVVITAVLVPVAVLVSAGYLGYHCTRNKKQKGGKGVSEDLLSYDFGYSSNTTYSDIKNVHDLNKGTRKDFDLPLFSYASVSAATNNFTAENKLGEGGFGPVYKGKSPKGQEIAVKMLSKRSGQGLHEFRNEITLIAKLQHRNLVGLLGCCIEQDENILIYEYMPNKSLDFFLFDPNKQEMLEWGTRARIIVGIAHGLVYLHEYSRLRIIHRDLKASNILLDSEMNPKISDFGMARIFGVNDAQANTNRIVGTYGYMAPEYAVDGTFSTKSDVFSFGVLVLEIVSGKKNTRFYHSDSLNLLAHAWELWTSGRAMELTDPALGSPPTSAVLRYINIGLLCVQEYPNDRPSMSKIISMISNEVIPLIKPKQPAFYTNQCVINNKSSSSAENFSVNGITISTIVPR